MTPAERELSASSATRGARALRQFRLATPGDEAFLDALYESTRLEEVLGWGFDRAAARTFLHQQAETQRRAFAMQFPAAEHRVLLDDGARAGRLIVDRGASDWAIIDVAVLPEHRGKGLATWALGVVLAETATAGRIARLLVDPGSAARRLYLRLGFREVPAAGDAAERLLRMEWRAC